MGKILTVLLLAVVVWWMWRKLQGPARPRDLPQARPPELMVVCARCGVNQPRSECLESRATPGVYYCSETHRRDAETER